ncbi:g12444 [Coccomyxa viridis]|uniref:Citrate synthase n=1 Tax=Coccomyxa viridis TaxID=1274662 RepID=A0ABP1GAD4_9CHLO
MSHSSAEGRLAALQRHLSAGVTLSNGLELQQTKSAGEQRPAPGGGPGTLTIVDNRTGKKYDIKVDEYGTIPANSLKQIKAGGDGVGLRTYDPGYVNTSAVKSAISFIDGDKGILRYRGYPIEQLAERSNFTEVAYLLIYGELPSSKELARWDEALMRHSAVPDAVERAVAALPHDAHFMGIVLTAINALSTVHPEQNPALAGQNIYKSKEIQDKQIVRLIGKMPAIAALAYHRASGRNISQPNQRLSYSENFLYMLDAANKPGYKPNPRLARAIDIMFTLHAEHEMNCSTAAARHLASSGVDVYTAIAGAVGALYGPLHGGANEAVLRMLERIGSVDNIGPFLEGVKNKKERMFGFGHRVYKNFDPRAKIIREVAEEVFQIQGRDPLIDVAVELEKRARADDYFVKRNLYPNVDFYSGLVYRAMGFPPQFFTVLFAVPRVTGYLSHWREQLTDPDVKIARPQQNYTGVWLRDYETMPQRQNRQMMGDTLGEVAPSNAYKRRVAGSNWS